MYVYVTQLLCEIAERNVLKIPCKLSGLTLFRTWPQSQLLMKKTQREM